MKNRAKCKKCHSIIESFHRFDYVKCSCESIAISGGLDTYEVFADDFSNILRIDDEENEIVVKVVDSLDDKTIPDVNPVYNENPTREDKLKMLDEMIKSYENLPSHALQAPITGYDLLSSLILVSSILRS